MTQLPPPSPGVVVSPFLDGLVGFVPASQELHRLGGSAELVWQACVDGLTVEALVAAVVEATGLDASVVASDVRRFVVELQDKGLVGPLSAGGTEPAIGADDGAGPEAGPVGEDDPAGGGLRSRALVVLDDRVVVRADDPALVAEVEAGFGVVDAPATREYAVVRADDGSLRIEDRAGRSPARTVGTGPLLPAVVAETNQAAAASRTVLALHAGGVQDPDRSDVVVLAAPSGSGKSTLTAALLGRGWHYLSDEGVGIRRGTLAAVPYPKPLSLGPVSREVLGLEVSTGIVPVDQVVAGCRALTEEVGPVSAVVLPRYEAGAEPTTERLDPEDALFAVAENAFNLALTGQGGLDTLAELAVRVPVIRLVHGGGPAAVDAVAALLEQIGPVGATGR